MNWFSTKELSINLAMVRCVSYTIAASGEITGVMIANPDNETTVVLDSLPTTTFILAR